VPKTALYAQKYALKEILGQAMKPSQTRSVGLTPFQT